MGIETNIHIGPYLVVEGTKTEDIPKTVQTCSNIECDKNIKNKVISGKFCSDCGSSVLEKKYFEKYTTDPFGLTMDVEYEDLFQDSLSWTNPINSDNEGVFIANKTASFDTKQRRDPASHRDVDLTNIDIKKEISWFEKEYKKQIDVFKK